MIPPFLAIAGLKLVQRLFPGSPGGPSRGAPAAPPKFAIYSVPEESLEAFMRQHPDTVHYSTLADQFAEAGFHEDSCELTRTGRELTRKYRGARAIVCCDFRRS